MSGRYELWSVLCRMEVTLRRLEFLERWKVVDMEDYIIEFGYIND